MSQQEKKFEIALSIDYNVELIDLIISLTKPIFDRRQILSTGSQMGAGSAEYFFEIEKEYESDLYREITETLHKAGITKGWQFLV